MKRTVALFDFDGTITYADTLTPFVRLAPMRIRALPGWSLLPPMVLGYHAGVVTAAQLRAAAIRVAFTGTRASIVREAGLRYATDVLPTVVRPVARERLDWHRQRGDEIVVVSASLDVYLRPWCEAQGVKCVCNMLQESDGILTGRFMGSDCGVGKAELIRQQFPDERYDIAFAYGDTDEDREMLALAHRRFYRWVEREADG